MTLDDLTTKINLGDLIFLTEETIRTMSDSEIKEEFDHIDAQRVELSAKLAATSKECYEAAINHNNLMAISHERMASDDDELKELLSAEPVDRSAIDALRAKSSLRCRIVRETLTPWNANIEGVAATWSGYMPTEDS